jgi:hypothetical protein
MLYSKGFQHSPKAKKRHFENKNAKSAATKKIDTLTVNRKKSVFKKLKAPRFQ